MRTATLTLSAMSCLGGEEGPKPGGVGPLRESTSGGALRWNVAQRSADVRSPRYKVASNPAGRCCRRTFELLPTVRYELRTAYTPSVTPIF
jgi:hypothetical protein